jgi:signal transduction histidine kinase/DNA-binding response OmpR family regulator
MSQGEGAFTLPPGGGEMGALIRAHDWSKTPLGAPSGWPQSLRTALSIMLTSRQPIWIGWGSELIYFYNDAYKSIIGGRHPWALGQPTRQVWREIWDEIGPMLATAMGGIEGTYVEEQLLIMERNGYPEETYYTFSYSPIPGDDGAPGGIICANTDDTQRVISDRQLALLRNLAAETTDVRSTPDACARAARALESDPRDILFSLLYLAEPGASEAELTTWTGIGRTAAPQVQRLDQAAPWVSAGEAVTLVEDLSMLGEHPCGPWSLPVSQAAVLRLPASSDTGRAGVLVVGLNPFRLFNEGYRDFLTLAAGQVAAAIAAAEGYEEERRRAEALAELDRAKTTFFSNISHEFRTPLTLMMGPLEDVLDGAASPDEVMERVSLAHRNGARLLRLVNSLLDFSRIEAGRVQAVFEPTDLSQFSAEIASSFRSAMDKAGLAFEIDCPPLAEPVWLDRDMWEKILLNLLSNAFKFTLDGGVSLHVGPAADGRGAQVRVSDTGAGIAAEELPRLFERFHRIEGAKGRSFEGSGIGLALVHELVKLHGGDITVESAPDEGSAFTVALPFGRAHLPADRVRTDAARPAPTSRAYEFVGEALRWLPGEARELPTGVGEAEDDSAPRPSRTGRRILLADDNADMRDYIARLLSGLGHKVEAVSDGEAALAAARRDIPDLVLSDVMMPRLDGISLVAALRQDPRTGAAPVILLSARAGEEARVAGLGAGADDYLIKPFSARELVARVESHLKLAALRNEVTEALLQEAESLLQINDASAALLGNLDLETVVQTITDVAVRVTGAQFGAFFYNVEDAVGERYTLYTLSGAPREAFERFPMPRNTKIFAPTFDGSAVVRSGNIRKDPRYGQSAPYNGMPPGHLPVTSYLAVPVSSRSGEVLGGLFFGHAEPDQFDELSEARVVGLASQAALAMENAELFKAAQTELRQRRQAEAELQVLNATLEQRVATALAEQAAAEEALRQAQKMEAVGQLTGGVAHDFNNLLTVIIGGLDTAGRCRPDEDARRRRALDMALQGAQRAASLTGRLLAFSRRQPLAPKPLDLNLLVRDMTELLHRTLGEHIELEGVLASRLWKVEADQNQLENAILNLALNARDAMEEGGKLTIETANTVLDQSYSAKDAEVIPGQYVVIAVSDSGTGMPPQTLERVFEPFFTTKEVGRGTGLGLSMVYGFIKQSGGHVSIYSEEGQGTTVRIYLPRYRGDAAAAQPEAVQAPAPADGSEVILVVEDNPDVRGYSTMILAELGYQLLEAADADAAIAILKSDRRIDLVFTDVVLPGRSGRVLADEAQRLRPGIRVLFTTGYSRNAIVHHGRLDPGVRLITKPFTFDELAARVRDVLDQPRASLS